jgi:hypothetical protein
MTTSGTGLPVAASVTVPVMTAVPWANAREETNALAMSAVRNSQVVGRKVILPGF